MIGSYLQTEENLELKELNTGLSIEVLLDNLRSAFNVGSIFRTADGIGIRKVYCCGITPSPDNPKVKKTALGAELELTWEYHQNGFHTVDKLRTEGKSIWTLEERPGSEILYNIQPPIDYSEVVLVVGNELFGIDPAIIDISDKVITIPMVGTKKSYNVAIAFGIAASFIKYLQW
jgi:tRNA G18 (ribose-2'-O)-methylase SpoU